MANDRQDSPQDRLRTRIDRNLAELSEAQTETGLGLAGGLTTVRDWLAEPGISLPVLRNRLHMETLAAVTAHKASAAAGNEDITAYARADALLSVREWLSEFETSQEA